MDRTDCVQSDVRGFGIAGDWKATALEEQVWVETVTEGGRVVYGRQEKRKATCQTTPIGPVHEAKECCTGAKRTETCVAPSCYSRPVSYLVRYRLFHRGGGGGRS